MRLKSVPYLCNKLTGTNIDRIQNLSEISRKPVPTVYILLMPGPLEPVLNATCTNDATTALPSTVTISESEGSPLNYAGVSTPFIGRYIAYQI